MRMCGKGYHDLDLPGNLVKRGIRNGKQQYACGPCAAGRTTEWDTFYRSTHDRLVCEYGHLFTDENVRWRRSGNGGWGRHCIPCRIERDIANKTGAPRIKVSQVRIAELHAEALRLGVDKIGRPDDDDNDGTQPEMPGDWVNQSRCSNGDYDPDMWYPEYESPGTTKQAKGVCFNCPVRQQCLDYALQVNERWGVWGGLDTNERVEYARRRRLQLVA